MFSVIFWYIMGLGLALPCTALIVFNLTIKAKYGDEYELKLLNLGIMYLIALFGWSIFIGSLFN